MKKIFIIVLLGFGFYLLNAQESIKPNGYNYIYHPNGSIQSEGLLKNGKPVGLWKNYYPTGIKKSEGRWKNNLLDSIWVFYTLSGDTSSKISYKEGLKNGYSYEYFTNANNPVYNGTLKRKDLYINNKIEGKSYTFYESGKVREESNYLDNKKEGFSIVYNKAGRIVTVFNYRKGTITDREKINRYNKEKRKDGIWREYYPDFKIKSECYFKNGLLNGYYKEYANNGTLIRTLLYKDDKIVDELEEQDIKSTVIEEYYDNGKLKSEGSFIKDKPIGVHKKYDRTGNTIIARVYNDMSILLQEGEVDSNGYRIGVWRLFYTDGKVKAKGLYKRNRREGEWNFFYENGVQEQVGTYEKGKYTGTWTWYYPNGDIWKEEEFYNGKNEGLYIEYSLSGDIIVEGEYFDGEREGEWVTQINDNKAVGKYVNGLMNGVWKHYYDNGQISFEGSYIQGTPDGKHKYYFSDGTLKEEQYYNNGIRQKHWKKFDENGHLFITVTYKNDKEFRINGVKINLPDDIIPTVIE